jgi:hypothetical protein
MAVTLVKVRLLLPPQATFHDYLTRPRVPDIEAVVPITFSSGFSGKAADTAALQTKPERLGRDGLSCSAESSCSGSHTTCSSSGHETARKKGKNGWLQRRSSSQREPPAQNRNHASTSGSGADFNSKGAYVRRTRVEGTGRRVKARLWLSSEVPLNQRDLLPLLDLMGTQNHYLGKVRKKLVL